MASESPLLFHRITELVSETNRTNGTSFVPLRGPGGFTAIADFSDETALQRAANGARVLNVAPKPINPAMNFSVGMLSDIFGVVQNYPNLSDSDQEVVWNKLIAGGLDGSFVRTDLVAAVTMASAMRTLGKKANEVKVVHYCPSYSIGSMLTFARLGALVGWRDDNPTSAHQTRHALMSVPRHWADAISEEEATAEIPPDIAIFDQPSPYGEMQSLTGRAAMAIVQTPVDFLQTHIDGWRLATSIEMPINQYALPTTQFGAGALAFQIWTNPTLLR